MKIIILNNIVIVIIMILLFIMYVFGGGLKLLYGEFVNVCGYFVIFVGLYFLFLDILISFNLFKFF